MCIRDRISKLCRLVEAYSRRLQNQERLATNIVDALEKYLQPQGAACVIRGHHMCMGCRGVNQPETVMTTSCFTGLYSEQWQVRDEFLSLVNRK
jgi:GTP cyclohydrolase I